MSESKAQPLLRVEDLAVSFGQGKTRNRAVAGVSLSIFAGQTLAVVGESGSGKSVSALSVLGLLPTPPARLDSGSIWWGQRTGIPDLRQRHLSDDREQVDLLTLTEKQMRQVRGNHIAMIFQEPMTSLNPVYTVGEQILEAVLLHQQVGRDQAEQIAVQALSDVGIAGPKDRLKDYPHQLSGGMRQRVMIAMALACQPQLLLADEPTTALDVTIQAQILELLRQLQHEKRMAVMLITHDLGVVAENADVVAVMYAGRVVEYATVTELFERPLHPYTRGLLSSMPRLGERTQRLTTVGDGSTIPDDFPERFKPRPHVLGDAGFAHYHDPGQQLYEVAPGHWVLCEPTDDSADVTAQATRPRLDYTRESDAALAAEG